MNLYLDFTNSTISGQGTDYVGPWTISGSFAQETAECIWIKQYLGKHRVRYQGVWGKTGILGRWTIGSLISGDFHIWPAEFTEIQAAYLAQEGQGNAFGRRQQ